MKKLILAVLLSLPLMVTAQDYQPPKLPNGTSSLDSFFKANLIVDEKYVTLAKGKYIQLSSKINQAGKMHSVKILNSQIVTSGNSNINAQALKVMQLAANHFTWSPGVYNGNKIEVEQIVTVLFNDMGIAHTKVMETRVRTGNDDEEIIFKEDDISETMVEYENEMPEPPPPAMYTEEEKDSDDEKEEENEIAVFQPMPSLASEKKDEEQEEEELEIVEDEEEQEDENYDFFDIVEVQPAPEEEKVFYVVEKMPEFPGGHSALDKFVSDNFNVSLDEEGTVYVQFVVNEDGSVTDIKVIKNTAGEKSGKEALRVIELMASKYTWTPGEQLGKKVKVMYRYPIIIKNQ